LTRKNDDLVVVAADCTGHGVPGAFMSMLGVAFLNEIVNRAGNFVAAHILNELRAEVKKSLRQTGKKDEAKDGMDIALCIINNKEMKLQFAGAYNPLYLVRNKELIQLKADRMPIGIYYKEKDSFTNHTIEILRDDCIYLFSDGYIDQFGGKDGKKFLTRQFQELILSIHAKPMHEQKQVMSETLEKWKGRHDQLDDILVIGFKIT
jgi:serine phosphatase RsbU (regulator of sigma subunit)